MAADKLLLTPPRGRKDLVARLGEDAVFATTYSGKAHLTRWEVNPAKPAEFYFRQLGEFLSHLVNTEYTPNRSKVFPPGIVHVWSPDGDGANWPLADLLGENPPILSIPEVGATLFMRVNTYHADFGMQSMSPSEELSGRKWPFKPWNPETGTLFVITHDPELSTAVSGLISTTSRFHVLPEQVMPALRDAYTR